LARKARMSERNARYVLRDLEASGELGIEDQAGPRGANLYRIRLSQNLELFEKTGAKVAGANIAGAEIAAAKRDSKGGNPKQERGQPIAPEPSLTVKEPSERYAVSPAVLEWAQKLGFAPWLEIHLEHFNDYIAQPKNRRRYTDLDAAFRSCVRADWGDVRFKAQMSARRGEQTGVPAGAMTAGEWWKTSQGVRTKAKEIGLVHADDPERAPAENFFWLKAKVCAAIGDGPWLNEPNETFQRYLRRARELAA
jgi:hypothetical protein